jgi:rubrerythrin
MGDVQDFTCAHCGYTASGKFVGDICPKCNQTYWKCSNCGFLITANTPPNTCPSCNEKCEFLNATCYTPDCGGPGAVDPRIGS